jgi:hypothetical protein
MPRMFRCLRFALRQECVSDYQIKHFATDGSTMVVKILRESRSTWYAMFAQVKREKLINPTQNKQTTIRIEEMHISLKCIFPNRAIPTPGFWLIR